MASKRLVTSCAKYKSPVAITKQFYRSTTSRFSGELNINSRVSGELNKNEQPILGVEQLDFENYKTAFGSKSGWELLRALSVLNMCSFKKFVNNSQKIMEICQTYAGENIINATVRNTFYQQFVGGDKPEEMEKVVARLAGAKIRPMVVCTMEEDIGEAKGEGTYDRNQRRLTDCLDLVSSLKGNAPLMQVKMTSIVSAEVLLELSKIFTDVKDPKTFISNIAQATIEKRALQIAGLGSKETVALYNALQRMHEIALTAKRKGICLLVDAEYSYVNAGISVIALSMMAIFNTDYPLIWNTYQCYLKVSLDTLKLEMDVTRALGVCFGAKLVRGAYITLEEERAKLSGHPSAVWESYERTNDCYNKSLQILLDEVKNINSKTVFVAATHNEESIFKAIKEIEDLKLSSEQMNRINFAQLYGMSDQITYPLASSGFRVYKSIPYGPMNEALPYLARRATENQAIFAGARKERVLLRLALRDRVKEFILK